MRTNIHLDTTELLSFFQRLIGVIAVAKVKPLDAYTIALSGGA